MKSNFFFIVVTCLISCQTYLCGQQRIGEWRDFLPYQQASSVTQSPDKIYYATPLSIASIDKTDMSVSFLSKVTGLSDIGVQQVRYDQVHDQLYVIYTNSNIDVIRSNTILNVPNIRANTSITGSKLINDIHISDTGVAYLSTDFGIVILDGGTLTFGATILTGVRVIEMESIGTQVFAGTDDGLYVFDLSSNNNIADFNNWNLLGVDQGLPSLFSTRAISAHNDLLYVGINGNLYRSNEGLDQWETIRLEDDLVVEFIETSSDRLIAGWRGPNFSNQVLFFDAEDQFISDGADCSGVPIEAIRDEAGQIWYADLFARFRMSSDYTSTCRQFNYNSPFSEDVSDIVLRGSDVLVASGGVAENFTFLFSRDGFYFQNQNSWNNFNEVDNSNIAALDLLNVFRVAFHPSLPRLYAGSYWAGLLEYDEVEDSYTLYNQTNSTLRGSIGDPARERVSGLVFDEDENLWITAFNAPEPINILTPEGDWISHAVPSLGTLSDIIIDDAGFKWMPVQGSNGGILVYDSGDDLVNTSDDRFRLIQQNNSVMTTNIVRSVKVDREGTVWVGTDEGPVFFDCGRDVFEEERCPGVRRLVLQDSIGAFLLADQQINTIEVDGANQKWFGTRSGVFVQSPQGEEQIAHFTADNSPLLDDEINALAYEPEEGIMWIGTNNGLVTIRTEATGGAVFHREDEVFAFPNPVPPDYRGPIAIRGLVTDANIKITDVNGLLVSEFEALGGQAIWDGLDLQGEEVRSGVYLVFSTDDRAFDNPDSFVTKILVIR